MKEREKKHVMLSIFTKMSKPEKANFKEIKNCVCDMLILRSMLELSGSFKSRA